MYEPTQSGCWSIEVVWPGRAFVLPCFKSMSFTLQEYPAVMTGISFLSQAFLSAAGFIRELVGSVHKRRQTQWYQSHYKMYIHMSGLSHWSFSLDLALVMSKGHFTFFTSCFWEKAKRKKGKMSVIFPACCHYTVMPSEELFFSHCLIHHYINLSLIFFLSFMGRLYRITKKCVGGILSKSSRGILDVNSLEWESGTLVVMWICSLNSQSVSLSGSQKS